MNTVGMPKARWWPDTRFIDPNPKDERFFFSNKTYHVNQVSNEPLWQRSRSGHSRSSTIPLTRATDGELLAKRAF